MRQNSGTLALGVSMGKRQGVTPTSDEPLAPYTIGVSSYHDGGTVDEPPIAGRAGREEGERSCAVSQRERTPVTAPAPAIGRVEDPRADGDGLGHHGEAADLGLRERGLGALEHGERERRVRVGGPFDGAVLVDDVYFDVLGCFHRGVVAVEARSVPRGWPWNVGGVSGGSDRIGVWWSETADETASGRSCLIDWVSAPRHSSLNLGAPTMGQSKVVSTRTCAIWLSIWSSHIGFRIGT